MDRITDKHLDGLCRVLNGGDVEIWTRQEDGSLKATVGAYYIDGAYGGVALYRMSNQGGGVSDVFSVGHRTKRDLYEMIRAFIVGRESAHEV
ncbi:MAG: hypothetical protein H0V97_08110 [Actinobacteria bacterium]|nr:hypothetical protein [Actinomycetota bacterium]